MVLLGLLQTINEGSVHILWFLTSFGPRALGLRFKAKFVHLLCKCYHIRMLDAYAEPSATIERAMSCSQ